MVILTYTCHEANEMMYVKCLVYYGECYNKTVTIKDKVWSTGFGALVPTHKQRPLFKN